MVHLLQKQHSTRNFSIFHCHFRLFPSFSPEEAVGIGYEMQPVYRHLLWSYRNANKDTMVGEPVSAGGNPGFNSGVLLLDLAKLRKSELYERLNEVSFSTQLALVSL